MDPDLDPFRWPKICNFLRKTEHKVAKMWYNAKLERSAAPMASRPKFLIFCPKSRDFCKRECCCKLESGQEGFGASEGGVQYGNRKLLVSELPKMAKSEVTGGL